MSDERPQRPANDDREAWKAYWAANGMAWRTEPEVDEARRRFLAERRSIKPDIAQGSYPFRDANGGVELDRADVEWLLATHDDGRGPVRWEEEKDKANEDQRWGPDLRGADLRDADLLGLPLVGLRGGLTLREWIDATPAQREQAPVDLAGADLRFAQLAGANLRGARLTRANLFTSRLAGASLGDAHLEGADLRRTTFDKKTDLSGVSLASEHRFWRSDRRQSPSGAASLGDILWGDADLTFVRWGPVQQLGDEREARRARDGAGKRKGRRSRLVEFEAAVRANRQLATRLRDQGMNDDADRFAYRAQFLQRQVLRRHGRWVRYGGSVLLDVISGYGYRPMRSVAAYIVIIGLFAGAYLINAQFAAPHLRWDEALVLSISSFHGRGFFTTGISLGDTLARLAAAEAIIGLLVEITFIATFTQRFFAR